jgi:hypothetical protein
MIRFLLSGLLALVIGLALGAWSAFWLVDRWPFWGNPSIGPWYVIDNIHLEDGNPYARASLIKSQTLPLGKAAGVTFFAHYDSTGEPLTSGCDYILSGEAPQARFWSLVALDGEGEPLPMDTAFSAPFMISSQNILWETGDRFRIHISSGLKPGNWLALPAEAQPIQLMLVFYQTSLSSGTLPDVNTMPVLERANSC